MYRYSWIAIDPAGNKRERWNEDGTENMPDPDNTVEFHLLPHPDHMAAIGLKPFSLFLKPGQRLIYRKRRHVDATAAGNIEDTESVCYIVGYEENVGTGYFASYCALLPDGRIEWSSNFNHITRHERNLDAHPLRFYETWPA